MNNERMLQNIRETLEVIDEQFSIISEYSGRIPQIELDIIKENIRQLYVYFNNLEKLNNPAIPFSISDTGETREVLLHKPPIEKKKTPEAIMPDLKKPAEEPVLHAEPPVPIPVVPTPAKEVLPPDPDLEETPVPFIGSHPATQIHDSLTTETDEKKNLHNESTGSERQKAMIDLFSDGPQHTLADKLKGSEERRVADKIRDARPQDLRNGIGINEKFLFVNELFSGKLMEYNKAIDLLDKCASMEESLLVLSQMKINNEWTDDSNAFGLLSELVRKRFIR